MKKLLPPVKLKPFCFVLFWASFAFGQSNQNNLPSTGGGGFNSTGVGTGYQDITEIAQPANPAAGVERVWSDSTAHILKCITSGGGSCLTGSSLWSGLGNPTGNLTLSMANFSTEFDFTSAVADGFEWANTTAAVVGTSQSSPMLTLCGRDFGSGADADRCATFQVVPGTGANANSVINIGNVGTGTGIVTLQAPGPVASGSDGVHPSVFDMVGNTTVPSITANHFQLVGPAVTTFTALGLQFSSAAPATGNVLLVGAPSSNFAQVTYGKVTSAQVDSSVATTGTGTIGFLPKYTSASAIGNSLLDDGITTANAATYTGTAGVRTPFFTATLANAGYFYYGQGTDNCAAQQPANSACFEAPAAVTSYKATVPGAAPVNNNSAWLFSNANPSVGAFAKMSQTGMVTAQQAGLTTLANLPGLSFSVEANTKYVMACTLYYQVSAGTANLTAAITGPASPTFVSYSLFDTDTATGVAESGVATAFATTLSGAGTSTATTNFPATITMGLSNGANAGTVQVQAGAVGTGNSTVQTGSWCLLQ